MMRLASPPQPRDLAIRLRREALGAADAAEALADAAGQQRLSELGLTRPWPLRRPNEGEGEA